MTRPLRTTGTRTYACLDLVISNTTVDVTAIRPGPATSLVVEFPQTPPKISSSIPSSHSLSECRSRREYPRTVTPFSRLYSLKN